MILYNIIYFVVYVACVFLQSKFTLNIEVTVNHECLDFTEWYENVIILKIIMRHSFHLFYKTRKVTRKEKNHCECSEILTLTLRFSYNKTILIFCFLFSGNELSNIGYFMLPSVLLLRYNVGIVASHSGPLRKNIPF